MDEKNISLKEFNTKAILKKLEGKKALCPSCEKRLKYAGSLYIYQNKETEENLYYIICRKCEYKKEKQTEEKKEKIKELIESRLSENRYLYSCEIIEDPNIENILNKVVKGDQKLQLKAFEETLGRWHKDDEEFFEENPERKFYARPIYKGELEAIHKEDPKKKGIAIQHNISFAIVHRVAKTQRVYEYVSDLKGHPYNEEAFVAALYMVRVNSMFTPDDIYTLYEKIKENKQIITDFKI